MPPSATSPEGVPSTPERIREAAIRLFADRGFHGTGIRDIVTAANSTLSSLYHHFGSKDDLLVEIMISSTAPLVRAAERVVAAHPNPAEGLVLLVEQHVWAHGIDRLAKLVTDTEIRALADERLEKVLSVRDGYEHQWRAVVENGTSCGVFDVDQPKITTIGLMEMCTGVSHWYRPGGDLTLQDLCHIHADNALALVRARRDDKVIRRRDLSLPNPSHFLEG
jgi:AcrR family transcriptional regulator